MSSSVSQASESRNCLLLSLGFNICMQASLVCRRLLSVVVFALFQLQGRLSLHKLAISVTQ